MKEILRRCAPQDDKLNFEIIFSLSITFVLVTSLLADIKMLYSIIMFKFWGKVRKHKQRGKKLGFPTANTNLFKKIPEGIYVSKTKVDGKVYESITFIGTVKIFNEKKFHAETYILDFSKDIYDKWISIELLKKIRENKKFNSTKDLIKQMKKDEAEARKYFKI